MVDTALTRQLFSTLIDRPPLTDHLLQRPPFKFIHDVVVATINATGFIKDLYTPVELDATKMIDKTLKQEFLEKLINSLNQNGKLNKVRPAKIIAGKDPELTNLLLQELAKQATISKEQNSSAGSNKENRRKTKKKETPVATVVVEEGKKKKKTKEESVDKTKKKKEKSSISEEKPFESDTLPIHNNNHDEEDEDDQLNNNKNLGLDGDEPTGTAKTEDSGIAEDMADLEPPPPPPPPLPPPSLQPRPMTAAGRPQTSMTRPGTAMARPAPPKMKRKQIAEIERTPDPVAETQELITEERKDDAEQFLIEATDEYQGDRLAADQLDAEAHGGLVKKILETKRELEQSSGEQQEQQIRGVSLVYGDNERDKTRKEIDRLQMVIQQLTQSSYPLSRLFDYLQEDMEAMVTELEQWRRDRKKSEVALREREGQGADASGALIIQLRQLDAEVGDMKMAIIRSKQSVLVNDVKLRSLLQ